MGGSCNVVIENKIFQIDVVDKKFNRGLESNINTSFKMSLTIFLGFFRFFEVVESESVSFKIEG